MKATGPDGKVFHCFVNKVRGHTGGASEVLRRVF